MPASQLDPVLESNWYTVENLPEEVGAQGSGTPGPDPAALRSDAHSGPSPIQCLLLSRRRARSESPEVRVTRGPHLQRANTEPCEVQTREIAKQMKKNRRKIPSTVIAVVMGVASSPHVQPDPG